MRLDHHTIATSVLALDLRLRQFSNPIVRLFAHYRRQRRLRRDCEILSSQCDHLLKDLGISRSQIHASVYGSAKTSREARNV